MLFSLPVYASENVVSEITIEEIDALLRKANTPEEQIEAMDDELKRMIYENTLSKEEVRYIEIEPEDHVSNGARASDSISTSELKLSVTAYLYTSGNRVAIYPSYEWLVPVKPKGKDYFAYSTHSSYSVVSGERTNSIWYRESTTDSWTKAGTATYTGSSLTGYQHQGSSLGTPSYEIYIKGNFYFVADIDTTPTKKIVLSYVHDTSSGTGYSYSVSYGPFSIGVTPSSSNAKYLNNVFDLNY